MMLTLLILFFKSLLIGVVVAMPLGPISMLIIKKSLENGLAAGFAIAIGAACADALYSGIAGIAIASVAAFITQYKLYLRIIGKCIMATVFVSELRHQPASTNPMQLTTNDKIALSSKVFLLTLANPFTILIISSVFLSLEMHFATPTEIIIAIIGIFAGSTLWCSLLSYLTVFAKNHLPSYFIDALRWFSLAILASFVIFI